MFRPQDGSPALVGVVGALQLDVLQVRLKDEYGLEVLWDTAEFALARWISADDPKVLDEVRRRQRARASPTISTAIRCISRATSSISATPASARRHRLHRRQGPPRRRQGEDRSSEAHAALRRAISASGLTPAEHRCNAKGYQDEIVV